MLKPHILIAGGGIAGISAALALEQNGFSVTVFEKAVEAQQSGAGLQLTPNATRLLGKMGVLPRLVNLAVPVDAIVLASGRTAKPLLTLNVGNAVERWRAPYLAVYRADLYAALRDEAKSRAAITIHPGSEVTDFAAHANGVTVSVTSDKGISEAEGMFLVGADGVWSNLRARLSVEGASFSGSVAYRKMLRADMLLPAALRALLDGRQVGAFIAPKAHLVAYPLRNCSTLNLVAITRGARSETDWNGRGSNVALPSEFGLLEPELAQFLMKLRDWSSYLIHIMKPDQKWSDGRSMMLIGDAAHAMAPFGAQGAAMAIEDAWTLAACLAAHRSEPTLALPAYENLRRQRIKHIARRTEINRFAYHADGLTATVRDRVFRTFSGKFMDGLDWIYAFDAAA